jgi:hypothetical protein
MTCPFVEICAAPENYSERYIRQAVKKVEVRRQDHRHLQTSDEPEDSKMIKTEAISLCALKIVPSEKLSEADFMPRAAGQFNDREVRASPAADRRIPVQRLGKLRGEAHISFIKNHERNVERIAAIVGHDWQHWVVDMARLFLHPEARAFDKSREGDAQRWVVGD